VEAFPRVSIPLSSCAASLIQWRRNQFILFREVFCRPVRRSAQSQDLKQISVLAASASVANRNLFGIPRGGSGSSGGLCQRSIQRQRRCLRWWVHLPKSTSVGCYLLCDYRPAHAAAAPGPAKRGEDRPGHPLKLILSTELETAQTGRCVGAVLSVVLLFSLLAFSFRCCGRGGRQGLARSPRFWGWGSMRTETAVDRGGPTRAGISWQLLRGRHDGLGPGAKSS